MSERKTISMSNQISQKDAVIAAVKQVLGAFTGCASSLLSKDQKRQVRELVFQAVMNGNVPFTKGTADTMVVRKYVGGLVDNHLRKAKELNGGTTYRVKNPGSGKGRRDQQLSALQKLLKQYPDGTTERTKIVEAIANREAELASTNNKNVTN